MSSGCWTMKRCTFLMSKGFSPVWIRTSPPPNPHSPKNYRGKVQAYKYLQTWPGSTLGPLIKNKGETTHQIGAKRPTGETTQGEKTQGETTHGRNDSRAKRPGTELPGDRVSEWLGDRVHGWVGSSEWVSEWVIESELPGDQKWVKMNTPRSRFWIGLHLSWMILLFLRTE